MLDQVIIDSSGLKPKEKELLSFIDLLCDDVIHTFEVAVQHWFMRHGEPLGPKRRLGRSKIQVLASSGVRTPSADEKLELSGRDEVVWATWDDPDDLGPTYRPIEPDAIVFSGQQWVRRWTLTHGGLTAKNSVLVLAAAGLELIVPNAILRDASWDDIEAAKEKLAEERSSYLSAITRVADEAFGRLTAGVYADTVDWARNESLFKLKPRADELQRKLAKLDRPLLRRMGVDFFTDGVPAIGKAYLDESVRGTAKQTVHELLRVLCRGLARSIEERRVPEANYGMKLTRLLQRRPNKGMQPTALKPRRG